MPLGVYGKQDGDRVGCAAANKDLTCAGDGTQLAEVGIIREYSRSVHYQGSVICVVFSQRVLGNRSLCRSVQCYIFRNGERCSGRYDDFTFCGDTIGISRADCSEPSMENGVSIGCKLIVPVRLFYKPAGFAQRRLLCRCPRLSHSFGFQWRR